MTDNDCPDILKKIIATKHSEIAVMNRSIADFKKISRDLAPAQDFKAALVKEGLSVISEIKKASPSAGDIAGEFNPLEIAEAYFHGAADALSILTDKTYFKGDIKFIRLVREQISIPILRKDFIIDPLQIYEARAYGADSFLLIAAVLETAKLSDMIALGREMGMEPLVESHDEFELEKTINAGAGIIGINNRNMHNFKVDLATSERLYKMIPAEAVSVAESGINTPDQARRLRFSGFDAVLVGESLMRAGLTGCGAMISAFKQ